jgi:hypothetical protein
MSSLASDTSEASGSSFKRNRAGREAGSVLWNSGKVSKVVEVEGNNLQPRRVPRA